MSFPDFLMPVLLELAAQILMLFVVPALVAWAGIAYVRLTGERLTAARRDRLHSVLEAGVLAAMGSGLKSDGMIADLAVDYAARNAPGVIKATKATKSAMREIARAKIAARAAAG